jgi:stage V sporulation protein S
MNRFFSKLNLQDIKINPEGNRFPPDADEHEEQEEHIVDTVEAQAEQADEHVASDNGYSSWEAAPVEAEPAPVHDEQHPVATLPVEDVASSNGHAHDVEPVAIVADGEVLGVAGEVLKVSARSRPSAVAGAIAGVVRESGRAEVQAIGAGATNQAVKAVAIARDYLNETGIEAVCLPAFIDVTIENEDRTAIRLVVEPR